MEDLSFILENQQLQQFSEEALEQQASIEQIYHTEVCRCSLPPAK